MCGVMSALIKGPCTAVLRAPTPLGTPLLLEAAGEHVRLTSLGGDLIGEARPAGEALAPPPAPPSYAEAKAAGKRFPGLTRPFHPVCFTCSAQLDEGLGLGVFVGQTRGAAEGYVSGAWAPHAAFVDGQGQATSEVVWAALDCPGSVSWAVMQGGGGLLGTMTCAVLRRPTLQEPCMVTAWPVEQKGRKRLSGTALFTADGELLAHSRQVWISLQPDPSATRSRGPSEA